MRENREEQYHHFKAEQVEDHNSLEKNTKRVKESE